MYLITMHILDSTLAIISLPSPSYAHVYFSQKRVYTVFDLYRPRVTPMFTLVRSGLYTVFDLYRPRVTPMFTLVRSGLYKSFSAVDSDSSVVL
jgi:hypothetical protein